MKILARRVVLARVSASSVTCGAGYTIIGTVVSAKAIVDALIAVLALPPGSAGARVVAGRHSGVAVVALAAGCSIGTWIRAALVIICLAVVS